MSEQPGEEGGASQEGSAEERLRDAILRGELEPGAQLSQADLSAQLGIGRTPLREAIRTLQRERLIVAEPFRRVRIADVVADDAEQLYLMRIALEGIAIRLTVPQLSSADVAQLEGYMAQMDHYFRERDAWGLRVPHLAFHALLVSAAGERVTDQIALLSQHAERYRLRFGAARPNYWDQRRAEHREILDAAVARDPEWAARALTRHYMRTAEGILDTLEPGREPAMLATVQRVVAGADSHEKREARR